MDPAVRYQRLEGWGVSLAWWAHIAGQKASPQQLEQLMTWLTGPEYLNMNIFRFNVGGGDAPGHTHMRRDAQLPGYRADKDAHYDWNADSAQRRVLLAIHRLRRDAIYEVESYSPPYWMTKSGCTSGGEKGASNLREDCYGSFAGYLTDVVKHFKDDYGIVFRTIAPVNEPFSNWWKNGGSQEGCAFNAGEQLRLISDLDSCLRAKGMTGYTSLSLSDANSIDECLRGFEGPSGAGLLKSISQINTHTYEGTKRTALHALAAGNGKRLWQSESGPLDRKERGWDNYLMMGQRIITDMRELQPTAWCDWQYMSPGGPHDVWALVGYPGRKDSVFEYVRTKGFFCREQFTRFIVPGSVFIHSEGNNSLAAI
ncbi:MAG: alpha-L-arabinofuranosidase, partial [Bacteroidetes bacterium]|nr:alpha-L-arabinofuranosidase [Bacteroidota bacterium]